jgi:exosortase
MKTTAENFFPKEGGRLILLSAAVFGFLWFTLINNLRVEWTLNPQYNYGWAVPFLCLYLAWRKIQNPEVRIQESESSPVAVAGFFLLAFLFAPTKLVEEANPEWRLVAWALAVEVVGLTLLAIYFALGAQWLKRLAFPICYFLVAVPWPTLIEQPLIQNLTRADANGTVELLGWLGIPAMPHGNVIEVATGNVGIDEACSGIRSFQATLMISLFLGESCRLNFPRRLALVFGGFAMSFLFNLARMSVLVWIAAHQGVGAIAKWHDPTGVTILVACFFCLWGLGIFLARKKKTLQPSPAGGSPVDFPKTNQRFALLLIALGVWIAAAEISVEWWYRSHEAKLPPAQQWTIAWPTNNPTFKEMPLTAAARQILRYDESRAAAWQENDVDWQAVFLRWNPGSSALHLAQNHTPEVCLTAAGHKLNVISELEWFDVNGLHLPFGVFQVTDAPRPFFVFYCLWDDRAAAQTFETMSLTYGKRLAPVLAGLRNPGERSIEIAVTGVNDAPSAEAAVKLELGKLILNHF